MGKKVYAIREGYDFENDKIIENVIVDSWAECLKKVKGVKGAKYKSFETLEEANKYLEDANKLLKKDRDEYPKDLLHIYVDGSFSTLDEKYSYGVVAVRDNVIEHIEGEAHRSKGNIRQIAGELEGAIRALEYAKSIKEKHIVLFHDYIGICYHATGIWARNDESSKEYYEKMNKFFNEGIQVTFVKVDSHTGDLYNELVDEKCKESLGIESDKTVARWLSKNKIYVANKNLKEEILRLTNGKEENIIIQDINYVDNMIKEEKIDESLMYSINLNTKEKINKNKIYYARGTEELKKKNVFAHGLVKKFNDSDTEAFEERENIIRALFGKVGRNPNIEHNFHCDLGYNIYVGDNFYAGYNFTVLDIEEVKIGDNCMIGPSVNIYTAGHNIEPKDRNKTGYGIKVTIGDNVWIGGNSTILPGVTIGDNSVIAAGSVVTSNVPKNVIVAGNPAKVLKKI